MRNRPLPTAASITVASITACAALAVAGCSSASGREPHATQPPSAAPISTTVSTAPSTPTPMTKLSSASAPAAAFPLTGLPAQTKADAAKPPLTVKIDNVAGAWPQAGLNQADLVVDTPVEGGLTRLFAVFQSHGAPLVGPVRSARPVDGDLLQLIGNGYFAYSGAAAGEIAPVKANSPAVLMSFDADNALFIKRGDHPSPHNVFATTDALYARGGAEKSGLPPAKAVFSYASAPATGPATSGVRIAFPSASAAWQWDGQQYLRTQDGRPDALIDGTQVSTTNVVVLSVALRDSGVRDSLRHAEPWPQVIGSGQCWVLRNGVRVHGTWTRASLTAPMTLRADDGKPIALAPGRTWIELAPTGSTPQFS